MLKFIIILFILILIFLSKNTEGFQSRDEPVYVFWTGGYDSTFRLAQLVIVEKRVVQPVYISDNNLDNKENKNTKRHNHIQEYNAMDQIKENIFKAFPFTKSLILPTIDIKNVNIDEDIEDNMKKLHKQKKVRRPVCQYGGMAQVTRDLDKDIEICVENATGSMMNRTIKDQLICNKNDCNYYDKKIKKELIKKNNPLKIFRRFVFSTIHLTKKDMHNISKKHKFDFILKDTWSCWYPRNGKPCGRCIMCHERLNL